MGRTRDTAAAKTMARRRRRPVAALAIAATSAATALASGPSVEIDPGSSRDPLVETGRDSDHLTGDWGGARSRLVGRGVHISAGHIGETLSVVRGGRHGGTTYRGLLETGIDLDLGPLTGGIWPGAMFRASSLWVHGDSLRARVGDDLGLSNIEGHGTVRLYDLWIEQHAFADRAALRVGQQVVDGEIATSTYSTLFIHGDFGWPASIGAAVHNNGPAYPVGVLGARLKVDLSPAFTVRTAVFDGDSHDDPAGDPAVNQHGTHFRLSGTQGLLAFGELDWHWQRRAGPEAHPGSLKAGIWRHTGAFADHQTVAPHDGNHGVYLVGEQLVWRESGALESSPQGLGVFARAGTSPGDRSRYDVVVDGGLNYHGMLPGRDDDTFGIGFVHAQASGGLRRAQVLAGTAVLSDHETVVEIAYRAQLRPWWSLQPGVLIVLHPGSAAATPDAVVLGLRSSLTF